MIPNTVTMVLKKDEMCYAEPLTQGDYGQKLVFEGVDLPQAYEVHFSNTPDGMSKSYPGDNTGVSVPDEFLQSGEPVYIWVFLHQTEDDGRTVYVGYIPVTRKSAVSNDPITPVQQDAFTQMMAILETAIEGIPDVIDAALQEAKDSGEFDGEDGFSPIITTIEISGGHRIRIEDAQEVTFVNVMDGKNGDDGEDGFDPIISIEEISGGHRIRIEDAYGIKYVNIMDGEDGNGIASVQLNPDYTLTLTFTDGTSSTTPSIRGEKGEQGDKGNTGPYFTPHIDSEGILTWTNTGGLPNPDPFDLGVGKDDVQEYSTRSQFPARGESGVIYIVSTTNKLYRWTGANYVEVSPFIIGETENTAFRGDHGKIAYDTTQAISEADVTAIGKALSPKTVSQGRVVEWQFVRSGGGSGTDDYTDLVNKPKINNVELSGDKSLHDLGAAAEEDIPDVTGKADKVTSATNGNFAGLDSNGNLTDSGKKASDFLTSHQDITGKADKVSGAINGNFAGLDSNGNLTDSGKKANDFGTYSKPSGGIPSTDLAEDYIVEPSSDGTSGQVLTTDGHGGRRWTTVQGGGTGAVIDDSAGTGDTDKAWSANKLVDEFSAKYEKPSGGIPATDIASGVIPDITGKADKVSGATNGNFAGLDSNGNLTDSGSKASDFLTSHQDITGKADKVTSATNDNFASLDANGNLKDSGHKHSDYLTSHQDITGKADKVSGATNGNFAGLDSNGNLMDSGKKASDFGEIPSKVLLGTSGTSFTIAMQSGCRAFIVGISATTGRSFAAVMMSTSQGAVDVLECGKGSEITFNKSVTNRLTITTTSTGTMNVLVFAPAKEILNGITKV